MYPALQPPLSPPPSIRRHDANGYVFFVLLTGLTDKDCADFVVFSVVALKVSYRATLTRRQDANGYVFFVLLRGATYKDSAEWVVFRVVAFQMSYRARFSYVTGRLFLRG